MAITLLEQLEKAKLDHARPAKLSNLIGRVAREQFSDPLELARFHDALLFLRAFPPNAAILKQTEILLQSFSARIERLKKNGADLSDIEDDEAWSGIVGTTLTGFLNFD